MMNNGPRIPNRYFQKRNQGNSSVIVALVLLGGLAYSHYGQSGMFDGLKGLFAGQEQQVAVEQPGVVAPTEPSYVTTRTALRAYNSLESMKEVAIIPAGTSLRVKRTQMDQQGEINWLMVKANGLNVWIKNDNLIFSE